MLSDYVHLIFSRWGGTTLDEVVATPPSRSSALALLLALSRPSPTVQHRPLTGL